MAPHRREQSNVHRASERSPVPEQGHQAEVGTVCRDAWGEPSRQRKSQSKGPGEGRWDQEKHRAGGGCQSKR